MEDHFISLLFPIQIVSERFYFGGSTMGSVAQAGKNGDRRVRGLPDSLHRLEQGYDRNVKTKLNSNADEE